EGSGGHHAAVRPAPRWHSGRAPGSRRGPRPLRRCRGGPTAPVGGLVPAAGPVSRPCTDSRAASADAGGGVGARLAATGPARSERRATLAGPAAAATGTAARGRRPAPCHRGRRRPAPDGAADLAGSPGMGGAGARVDPRLVGEADADGGRTTR